MRALVVSDVCFYRESIISALAADGVDADAAPSSDPQLGRIASAADVAIVDLSSADLTATVEAIGASCPVVGLAVTTEPPVVAAAALGIRAFVGPAEGISTLVRTVRLAAAGEAVCPNSIAAALFASLHDERAHSSAAPVLTRRELEIGRLVTRGLSNSEIASELFIETATVKNHVHQILRKLELRRRGQVAARLLDV